MTELKQIDFFNLESTVWLANKPTHVPVYDFQFEPLFEVRRPRTHEEKTVIARIGAIGEYDRLYEDLLEYGYRLVNSPEQHKTSSELACWYPEIHELTPKSKVYDSFPPFDQFLLDFSFPVFIKGNRQTAKHNPELSIAKTKEDFFTISNAYQHDPILHWQKIVIREFVPLLPMNIKVKDKVQISFEFRTFWWKQQLVGAGHYWSQFLDYSWTKDQEKEGIEVARIAAEKLAVPFIAIDLALTADNNWIIIECNDAQESGYCGVNPIVLWKNIINYEK